MGADIDHLFPSFAATVHAIVNGSGGKVTITSTWRSYQQQLGLRQGRCPDPMKSKPSDCHPQTAIPGTSMHEVTFADGTPAALACDFGGDLAYVASVAARYGIHRTVASEAWHYEPIDSVPLRALVKAGATWKGDHLGLPNGQTVTPHVGDPSLTPAPFNTDQNLSGSTNASAGAASDALHTLTDPHTYLRVGMFMAGATLGVVALLIVFQSVAPHVGDKAMKRATPNARDIAGTRSAPDVSSVGGGVA